jgi:hypothetical protein
MRSELNLGLIASSHVLVGRGMANTTCDLSALAREFKVIGSSDEVHVVDALAITGDEGRASLRKAAGSWQRSFDPQMSEWGNPPLHRWLSGALCER